MGQTAAGPAAAGLAAAGPAVFGHAVFGHTAPPRFTLGLGLKMYLGYEQSLEWMRAVGALCQNHTAVQTGAVEVFVLPGFLALASARTILAGSGVRWGAQDVFWSDSGAFTGEVGAPQLREIGCSYVEIGHAERRVQLGESEAMVAAKTHAVYRNGLTPVVCVGEEIRTDAKAAALECIRQLDAYLGASLSDDCAHKLIVAYEPQWAIGVAEPAQPSYIFEVVAQLRAHLEANEHLAGSRVIYGGSACAGLLTQLDGAVDGLFLGRFGHAPASIEALLDEAWLLCG